MNDFENNFTLQLFHLSDQEANTTSVELAPNLSAIYNVLSAEDIDGDGTAGYADTLFLSSGDAWIPGLFYEASTSIYGIPGAADIAIQNELGIQAISFGNHEFDQGTEIIGQLISGEGFEAPDGARDFTGTAFPYLTGNVDFSADPNLAPLVIGNGAEAGTVPNSIAEWVVITTDSGERIGIVASTTPAIDDGLTSPGSDVVVTPAGLSVPDTDTEFDALAATIQEDVDALLAANQDIDKVILLSHQQVLSVETELATRLSGVDIIMAGGSNDVLLDQNDVGFDGEPPDDTYPLFFTDADGNPIAVINTDAAYNYLGRLVIDFDENGFIIPESYDAEISGAYETSDEGVARVGATGMADPEIVEIAALVEATIVEGESNFFGVTTEFLNAERAGGGVDGVRTQETNLGNLTADANLWYVQQFDDTVVASFKNGGGIRANIGSIVQPGGGGDPVRLPPEGVPGAKPAGGISENDVGNVLAFNNGLTLLSLTAAQIVATIESTVANYESLDESAGDWGQFAGIRFSFDPTLAPGSRVVNAAIVDEATGSVIATLAENGVVSPSTETFRIVTLDFLANGGNPGLPVTNADEEGFDPAIAAATDRVDLVTESATGPATIAPDGSEQDALSEYLLSEFGRDGQTTVDLVDTSPVVDKRIQNLDFRSDSVFSSELPSDATEASLGDAPVSVPNVAIDSKITGLGFTPIAGGWNVSDGEEGVDLLGVETIQFASTALTANRGAEAAAVARYYEIGLDRAYDLEGGTYWTSRIVNGVFDADQLATAFLNSGEFAAANGSDLSNEAFVDALISNAGIEGLDSAALVASLDAGTSRTAVFSAIANSPNAVAALENLTDDGVLLFI
ncbi:MAG: 5'-nucleotidase C-terminal domain-containing protein [Pseudomonadota bacterium]